MDRRVFFFSSFGPQAESTFQAADLRRGVEILIATPGRLLDFLEEGTCVAESVAANAKFSSLEGWHYESQKNNVSDA